MIENINEIKYPVIVESINGSKYLYENKSSACCFGVVYKPIYGVAQPIQENDTLSTKEFLQGKYVRVKCLEEMDYIRKLCGNVGMLECGYSGTDFVLFSGDFYAFYNGEVTDSHSSYEELILPFPDSIYQKDAPVEEEQPTTEPLSEDFSSSEGDSIAERLHTLSERYTLFYSFHPSEGNPFNKSYFLVDYKDVSYKIDSVAKVSNLEKMIMIERGLCYEE